MPNIIMADQPSSGMVLLGSGDYTQASDTHNDITIPVEWSGTMYAGFVELRPEIDDVAHTSGWQWGYNMPKGNVMTSGSQGRVRSRQANNTYNSYTMQMPTITTTPGSQSVKVKEASSSYIMKAGTYHWEIWGVK